VVARLIATLLVAASSTLVFVASARAQTEPVPTPPAPQPAPLQANQPRQGALSPGQERALELHDEARALYTRGKYDEAVAKLREAVELDPSGKVLHYNLGLIEEKRGNLDAAIGDYRRCLDLETNAEERVSLARIIKRLEGAREYRRFESPTEPEPTRAPAPTLPEEHGVSGWVWVTGGVALAAFSAAAILALRAHALEPDDDARTSMVVSIDDLRSDAAAAHDHAVGADVMLVVGGAATVVTVVLALTTGGANDDALSLDMGPTRGAATWRF
jgi:tetratricopeptide (TPR) repeat protein